MCCWQLTGDAVDKAPEDSEVPSYNDIYSYFVTECLSKMASMQYLFDESTWVAPDGGNGTSPIDSSYCG
eukprot:184842-Rhodomonas_salina.1